MILQINAKQTSSYSPIHSLSTIVSRVCMVSSKALTMYSDDASGGDAAHLVLSADLILAAVLLLYQRYL